MYEKFAARYNYRFFYFFLSRFMVFPTPYLAGSDCLWHNTTVIEHGLYSAVFVVQLNLVSLRIEIEPTVNRLVSGLRIDEYIHHDCGRKLNYLQVKTD